MSDNTDTYEPELEYHAGDIYVFDDPDAGLHPGGCPMVSSCIFVGYIRTVEWDKDSDSTSLSPHGLGRIDPDDGWVDVIPTTGAPGVQGRPLLNEVDVQHHVEGEVRAFYGSDYELYRYVERHPGYGAYGRKKTEEIGACKRCLDSPEPHIIVDGQ
jgi:hypothetical protein